MKSFEELSKYFHKLAKNKLGFPTSFLCSNKDFVDNEPLGIKPNSLANILINEVGDPFKKSNTWRMEVKEYEVEVIDTLARHFGVNTFYVKGYITSGGTEANEACLGWLKEHLSSKLEQKLNNSKRLKKELRDNIEKLEEEYENLDKSKGELKIKILENIKDLNISLRKHLSIIKQIQRPVIICSEKYTHYCINKISNSLGFKLIGADNNKDGSISLVDLKVKVNEILRDYPHSPIIINANIGNTRTGAIDNVPEIKSIMENLSPKPLYAIHMDGAMYGLLIPILQPFGSIKNYFKIADTLAMSFHKYLGVTQPCGAALTNRKSVKDKFKGSLIEYAGNIIDTTVSGSRSGLNVLLVYNAILNGLKLNQTKVNLKKIVDEDLSKAKYFYKKLAKIYGKEKILYVPYQFNIVIPKPTSFIIKKYQLMVEQDTAVISVFNNVSYDLINKFIKDLQLIYKENKNYVINN